MSELFRRSDREEDVKRVDQSGWKFSQYAPVLVRAPSPWTGRFLRQSGNEAEIHPDGEGIQPTRWVQVSSLSAR